MRLPTGRVLLRTVARCSLWVVGKSGKRPREISRVRFAHEKTRIFGAHKCHPVMVLYGISLLPDSRPQTPDPFFPIHQSLITSHYALFTSHQTPLFAREAILACVSRLAKAKPLLAAERSSHQKRSLSLFLVGSCY